MAGIITVFFTITILILRSGMSADTATVTPPPLEITQQPDLDIDASKLPTSTAEPPTTDSIVDEARRAAIRDEFLFSWTKYRENAWGFDEYDPLSKRGIKSFDLGLNIVDAIDTIYLMGLKGEYEAARSWIRDSLNVAPDHEVNLFETTIRVLGGLLSIFHLTHDEVFLKPAIELGDRLMGAFSDSPVPVAGVNLATKKGIPAPGSGSSTSEVSTIQMEFAYLSYLSKDSTYQDKADEVIQHINRILPENGLVPLFIK